MGKWSIWKKNNGTMTSEGDMDNSNMDSGSSREQMYIPGGADKLDDTVSTLIEAILECEEYLAYREELGKVLQQPGLKEKIDEYRKRNYELQSLMDIDFEKLDRFEKEYENFRSDSAVSDFLEAELAFCKRMQAIENRITAELDFQ
ncbi:MAG: YlbF family regulator [Firmicutes bacterium]|nr:YlbF family regulator [Bacillota bacterium]